MRPYTDLLGGKAQSGLGIHVESSLEEVFEDMTIAEIHTTARSDKAIRRPGGEALPCFFPPIAAQGQNVPEIG